ncbi:aldehyde dehydrogenase family protein, partial [Streptomyces sp. NPDC047939]|uniref:aldehyde dehydrogenase family protein n=1 Tax=Streptomyces sp. NPDC047939 TaxID=3155381 RepID=UPI0034318A4E
MTTSVHPEPVADLVDGRPGACRPLPGGLFRQNPVTGEDLDPVRASTDARVESALDAAHRVHRSGAWAMRPDAARADALDAAAGAVEARAADITLAESFGSGVPHAQT